MNEEIAVLKASRNQVAVRHGLPPIGALLVNQHGIEWLVDGHLHLPTLATIARRGVERDDREDPQDLYPVILPQNLSPRLTEFIAETSRCTSKSIMPVDTMPSLRPKSAHPESYSVDGQTSPYHIVVFLDAVHVHETIFAHEIGHIWIDLVEDCEDYRILKDLSNTARVFQWTSIQSFVLDMKVNEVLREKGFDMSIIEAHVEEALASLSLAVLSGYRPPEPREAAFLANTLASAMLDNETGAADTLQSLDMAALVFQRDLPGVYELACHLAASVRKHGYNNRASIRKAIDECASLSFRYIGEPLDLKRDLIEETPEECYEDKYPEWFPGLPVAAKLEIGKAMASQRIPAGAEYRLNYSPGRSVQIQFARASGEWTVPILLHHAHRLPHDVAFAGRSRSLLKGNATMNMPKSSPAPVQQSALTPFGNVAGQRTYAPGLALFLSRVRLDEQLIGEHPYDYALNNPITYIDPWGLEPCYKPPIKCCCKVPSFNSRTETVNDANRAGWNFIVNIQTQNVVMKNGDKEQGCSLQWFEKAARTANKGIPTDTWVDTTSPQYNKFFGDDLLGKFAKQQPTDCPSKPATFRFVDPAGAKPPFGNATLTQKLCIRVVVKEGCTGREIVRNFWGIRVIVNGKVVEIKPPGKSAVMDAYCKYP